MQVNPDAEIFGEIKPVAEILEDYDLEGRPDDELLVTGPHDNLLKLQRDLEKAGYRQVFSQGPLKP